MRAEIGATYRLQLNANFTFDDAAKIVEYLSDLGITHVYTSPFLQAAPGSQHGYDVVDHSKINAELGGQDAYRRFCDAADAAGLGQVMDIVPNHMAVGGPENAWWWDVLENGPSSQYASYFDVDWDPPESKLRNMVLLPVLGDHYGKVLDSFELSLDRDGGSFFIRYADAYWPVAPRSLDRLLQEAAEGTGSDELESIAKAFGRLPPSTATDLASVRERHRDKEVLRSQLQQLLTDPVLSAAVDQVVAEIDEDPDLLHELLDRQNYRLAYWKTASTQLDYRRFFDIDSLAALRAEDPEVFRDTHGLITELVGTGTVNGLRVDHPDGLKDPEGYLRRLNQTCGGVWTVIEKILTPGETLPETWPVAGTTGYEFASLAEGLFVDAKAEDAFTRIYEKVTGSSSSFEEVAHAAKLEVMEGSLSSDLRRVTALFVDVCEKHRRYRDHSRDDLSNLLKHVVAAMPVYRTYVDVMNGSVTQADREVIAATLRSAQERDTSLDLDLVGFLQAVWTAQHRGHQESELIFRLQQLSGPVMAKGVEDTAFYRYNRLVSLNEVGGDPSRFGTSIEDFHGWCSHIQAKWPGTLLASSTHDSKRSEDVRNRIHCLTTFPEEWEQVSSAWFDKNWSYRDSNFPDANMEYLLYQTLVGAYPISVERVLTYMSKAAKEAKEFTSWVEPNEDYDRAMEAFVAGVLSDDSFVTEVQRLVGRVLIPARTNSLALTLLKLTCPGIPDIYQGSELWDLSLVDPDNRRPVDFETRTKAARSKNQATVDLRSDDAGTTKLSLIKAVLGLRRRHPGPFAAGDYKPLQPAGRCRENVVAFTRADQVVTVVPRLSSHIESWGDTRIDLPPGEFVHLMTRQAFTNQVSMQDLFARWPVAALVRTDLAS